MEFLITYALLALLAALLVIALISMPVMDRLLADGVENSITENRFIYYLTSLILGFIAAPASVLIVTSFGRINEFRDALYNELQKA